MLEKSVTCPHSSAVMTLSIVAIATVLSTIGTEAAQDSPRTLPPTAPDSSAVKQQRVGAESFQSTTASPLSADQLKTADASVAASSASTAEKSARSGLARRITLDQINQSADPAKSQLARL